MTLGKWIYLYNNNSENTNNSNKNKIKRRHLWGKSRKKGDKPFLNLTSFILPCLELGKVSFKGKTNSNPRYLKCFRHVGVSGQTRQARHKYRTRAFLTERWFITATKTNVCYTHISLPAV